MLQGANAHAFWAERDELRAGLCRLRLFCRVEAVFSGDRQ
jgi:hypothetical protein